jgi:hypothetical protein
LQAWQQAVSGIWNAGVIPVRWPLLSTEENNFPVLDGVPRPVPWELTGIDSDDGNGDQENNQAKPA